MVLAQVCAVPREGMRLINQCVWVGASGNRYVYKVCQLPKNFMENQYGNYIYCKVVGDVWIPIYIGHGNLSTGVGNSHHQTRCIQGKGATHVHIRYNEREKDCLREEVDLLDHYPQAYIPTGCNMRTGA